LTEKYVLRTIDDPSEVVLFFEVKDVEKAKEFAASPGLREAMQKAGVVDKPDSYFLS
jgi:hypothetical protein